MNTTQILLTVGIAIVSYFIGGLSPAVFLSRKVTGKDIRASGSGNAGASNMLRNVGVKMGILTFSLDVLKGVVPTLLALLLVGQYAGYAAGLAVVLGHIYPAFLGFKGGKGVATSFGMLLVLQPLLSIILVLVAFAIMFTTRMISLGSIIAAALYPVCGFLIPSIGWQFAAFSLIACGLIIIKHKENIVRIFNGTETRIDPKKLKR
jgi:acyl phosphate:glycerol-3-phosphate acyltransferase